jgi:hypothetical protein
MPSSTNKLWPYEMQTFIKYILKNKCEVTFDEKTNILSFPTTQTFKNEWNKILNKNNNYATILRSFSNYKIKAFQIDRKNNIFKFKFPDYFTPNKLLIKHYINLFNDVKEESDDILVDDDKTEIDDNETEVEDNESDVEDLITNNKKDDIIYKQDEEINSNNINNIIKFNKYITNIMISKYKKNKYKKNILIVSNLKKHNNKLNKLIYNIMELLIS